MNSQKIKEEILEKVKEYYHEVHELQQTEFEEGKTVIPFARKVYDEKELVRLVDASLEFWLTTGRHALEFENNFSKYMGQNHCILVNSGSSANLIALSALTSPKLGDKRLKEGDEVITVAAGFPTTVAPIVQNRLVPVFVDVTVPTYNIDVRKLELARTEKTKAVMIAHTLGNPFDLDAVSNFCKMYDLYLIEDCCDAVGSLYNGKMVGTFGNFATTSFYPAHHLTMGEGGAVLTSDPLLAQIATSMRDWGRDCTCDPGKDNTCGKRFDFQFGEMPIGYDHKYVYSHLGYNLKLTDMQAAVGIEQLKKLPEFVEKRRENYEKIRTGLEKYQNWIILPEATPNAQPSWFGMPLSIIEGSGILKVDLIQYLEKNKIMTRQLFAGNMVRQPAFKDINYRVSGTLENTDYIMNNTFFIGVYPGIDDEKIAYIIKVFDQFFNKIFTLK